jgi:amino-acid N-acetyltransferase
MKIRGATEGDVRAILEVLAANHGDTSLFQQADHQVRSTIEDFILAVDDLGRLDGCAAVHWHSASNAEILAVAVRPAAQGRGIGNKLVRECIDLTVRRGDGDRLCLWLATAKPNCFARFDFRSIPRSRLPFTVLWRKLLLVFQQPIARWLPALLGRHTFMQYSPLSPAA